MVGRTSSASAAQKVIFLWILTFLVLASSTV